MARINVDLDWWIDPRRRILVRALNGNETMADGAALAMWALGAKFWKNDGKVPKENFFLLDCAPALIEAKLAIIEEDCVAIKGVKERSNFMKNRIEAAKRGGVKSAELRRNDINKLVQAKSSKSNSPSQSPSQSQKETTFADQVELPIGAEVGFDFEALYNNHYPRKEGKSKGLKICKRQIKNQKTFDEFKRSVINFAAKMKAQNRPVDKIPYFSSFMSEWRDHVDSSANQDYLNDDDNRPKAEPGFFTP